MFNPLEIFANNALWSRIDVFFYMAVFMFILYALYENRRVFIEYIEDDRSVFYSVLGVMVLALLIRAYFYLPAFKMDASLWEYVVAGRKFVQEGLLYKCYGPVFENCANPVPVSHPALYALFLGMMFSVVGFSLESVIFLSILASVVTVWIVYQILSRLVDNSLSVFVGLFSVVLIPIHVIYGVRLDGGLAVFSVLSGFLVILATVLVSRDSDNLKYWLLLAASWVFSASLRWENPLMIMFSLVYLYVNMDDFFGFISEKVHDSRWVFLIVFSLLLMVVPLKGIYTIWIRPDNLSSGFGFGYVLMNLFRGVVSIWGFFGMMVLGLFFFSYFVEDRSRIVPYAFWIVSYFVVYTVFQNGLSHRYIMNLLPPMVILVGIGFDGFLERFDLDRVWRITVFGLFVLGMVFSLSGFKGYLIEDDVGNLVNVSERYGDETVVFADTNSLLAYMGMTNDEPAFAFLNLDKSFRDYDIERFYFVETRRCNIDIFNDLCGFLVENGREDGRIGEWTVYEVEMDREVKDKIIRSVENNSY